jgi:hypothetical protein
VTTRIASKGVDLDNIFDPYVTGTSPGLTGEQSAGTDIHTRYAPLVYGTAAAATGISCKVGGAGSFVDLNTLFAAKGTANYALPINGQTYTSNVSIVSGTASATINFAITSGSNWAINASNTRGVPAPAVLASGTIPSGAVTVKFTWGTYTVGAGHVDAGGSTTNGAAAATAISSNPAAVYTTALNASNSGSRDRQYPFTVDFYNSGSVNISHSVCTLICDTEGSV